MPEPFRLFVPPPVATEKLLLITSGKLRLALPVIKVQQVLLQVPVVNYNNRGAVEYQGSYVPVILEQGPCPPSPQLSIALMQTQSLKSGLVAIACSTLPKLLTIDPQDWISAPELKGLWQSNGKAYKLDQDIYICVTDVVKRKK